MRTQDFRPTTTLIHTLSDEVISTYNEPQIYPTGGPRATPLLNT